MNTPDTFGYMLLGYAVLFGMPFLYLVSWWFRRRNLERDLEAVQGLAEEEKPADEAKLEHHQPRTA
jgi:hypothetical protein